MASQNEPKLTFTFSGMDGEERLRELILYVSQKCSNDPCFGATKLNKILYFADFVSYQMHGEPITGVEYMRLGKGPVPKRLIPMRKKMIQDGELALEKKKFYEHEQHRTIPLREPDLELFKPRDIALIDEIILVLWGQTAEEVSDLSHDLAWRIPDDRESIPYQASYIADVQVAEDDVKRAREIADKYGVER